MTRVKMIVQSKHDWSFEMLCDWQLSILISLFQVIDIGLNNIYLFFSYENTNRHS